MLLAALLFGGVALARGARPWKGLHAGDVRLAALAGIFLGLHFATWISSLAFTSVASSVVLVTTNPIFVALGAGIFLGERVSGRVWAGLALAIGGSLLVGLSGSSGVAAPAPRPWLGDALALSGAVFGSGYILIGRRLRARVANLDYVTLVYGAAAGFLVVLALVTRSPLHGFSAKDWACLVAIAVICQGVGHSLLNWALRFVPPTQVAVSILGEPVGASLLAWWILGEAVGGLQLLGAALILGGVAVAVLSGSGQVRPVEAE